MFVISKCIESLVPSVQLPVSGDDTGGLAHYNFYLFYKLITSLIMNYLTCWQLLVKKTHRYQKNNSKTP